MTPRKKLLFPALEAQFTLGDLAVQVTRLGRGGRQRFIVLGPLKRGGNPWRPLMAAGDCDYEGRISLTDGCVDARRLGELQARVASAFGVAS